MSANPTQPDNTGFATRAIHFGYRPQDHQGALVPPLYQSATYAFPSVEDGAARFAGEAEGFIYSRIGNPTLDLLERRVAALERGEAGIAFASGMGAITSVCWSLLRPGDQLITDKTLYGCTHAYFQHALQAFGIRVTVIDMSDPAALAAAFSPQTRLVYCESPANPNMRLADIAALAKITRAHGALLVVDNTYATPYLQNPLALGADIVVHSATKYLGGHGDLMAGVAVMSAELATTVRMSGLKDMTGAVLSAQDAQLVLRGLKTLVLRMERHCDNAEAIANYLSTHPAVAKVRYPGLASFAQHALAIRQMRRFGGMIAFELHGGFEAGRRFMNALNLITRAVSLGDAETLAQHPASMTHATYTPEERAAAEIGEGLVRISAGLEDVADILADIEQALAKV
jgi:methionine-gamma-lyase